jgi:hypothetical protein
MSMRFPSNSLRRGARPDGLPRRLAGIRGCRSLSGSVSSAALLFAVLPGSLAFYDEYPEAAAVAVASFLDAT